MVVDYLIIADIFIKDSIKTKLVLLYICSQVDLSREKGTQSVNKSISNQVLLSESSVQPY